MTNVNRTSNWLTLLRFGILSFALTGLLLGTLSGNAALAQEAATADQPAAEATTEEATAEEATTDTPAAEPEATETEAEPEATKTEPADEPATEEAAADDAADEPTTEPATEEAVDAPAADPAAAEGDAPASDVDWGMVGLVLACILLPFFIGNWFAKQIKMPDHAWKIITLLLSVSVGALAVTTGDFKGGPDLVGGITLIFEIDEEAEKQKAAEAEAEGRAPQPVKIAEVIGAIKQRIDPAGTKEVVIREYGKAIEIIIPQQSSEAELDFIKNRITALGELEFRITASPRWKKDAGIIKAAEDLGPSQKLVRIGDRIAAEWVSYDEREFGPPEQEDSRLIKRVANGRPEALVLRDPLNVTGEYLANVGKGLSQTGGPAVDFLFDAKGAKLFGKLSGDNLQNQATGAFRNLGIMLDKRLISAPNLQSRITDQGQISGGAMTDAEVDNIIQILKAGSLPVALNKTPISEEVVSAAIGEETVRKGTFAMSVAMGATLLFMLLYYRFGGIIACLALATNVLLVLAIMVMIKAAFTLPGLAGLVLTVGMSVDANVLIFERIREELARGSALRMAIRNGFDRATTTIVDANLTTLITGIVLYVIGTDQIRGFAVTLVLGILMSMYTAIFGARVLFEIAERRRWITKLNFTKLVGDTQINFIGKRGVAMVMSLALIAIGLFAVVNRGASLLDIDFTGGSSVTMVLKEAGDEISIGDVRQALGDTELADQNFTVVERRQQEAAGGEAETASVGKRYTINSAVEEVDIAKKIINDAFPGKLQTYKVEVGDAKEFTEGDITGTEVTMSFNDGPAFSEQDGMTHDALLERIERILGEQGKDGLQPILTNPAYTEGSSQRFKEWTLRAPGLAEEATMAAATALQSELGAQPIFPLANKIGGKVAGNLQSQAVLAILASLVGIVAYIWFRFQNVSFGLAAVVALVHDVLVTLGAIALSAYVVNSIPALATALQLDAFQISLPIVAAFLTIIGYSLNDTIVVFDRIREVRGKSPGLTATMINTSINQTLSRTLLTSLTTLIVVGILYFMGGAGIHAFAFALVVGVIVGTYSSIFIASPALLAMIGTEDKPS